MTFQIKYNPTVSFPVKCLNMVKLSAATETVPASYRLTYNAIGRILGSDLAPEIGYYLYDNFGIPFEIFAVGSGTIDVYDQFNTGECPANGKTGIIVKSVWKGRAPILSSVNLQYLHPTAVYNINKWNLDILWSNDPNSRRIAITSEMQPSIADYRSDLTDMDGVVFNPMSDYDQNPKFEIYQDNGDGTYPKLQLEPQITRSLTDGLIDSVLWSSTGDLLTGFITISK